MTSLISPLNISGASQVCGLSEELRSVREERDALISARSSLNEDHQRLKDEATKAQDQLLKMESDLVEAQLKEAELGQQLSERLQNLQRVSQENSTLLASSQKVTTHYTLTTSFNTSDLTLFLPSVAAAERRAGVGPRRERCASVGEDGGRSERPG